MKPGDKIGKQYMISKQLGSGRFSEVFVGISMDGRERRVAIKVLKDKMDNPYYRKAFDVEVMALRTLKHENIVSILGSGRTEDGFPYLVMPMCAGRLAPGGGWNPSVAPLVRSLLAALQSAHAAKVIHRDIKPQHILYRDADRTRGPKIVDFGIAKIRRYIGPGVTLAGYGTPGYACEDQIAGKEAQPYFDLYAVAACLVWYFTGSDPIPGVPLSEQIINLPAKMPDQFRSFLVDLTRTDEKGLTAGTALRTLEQLSSSWEDTRPYYLEVRSDVINGLAVTLGKDPEDSLSVLQNIEDDLKPFQGRYPVFAVQENGTDPVAALSYKYRLVGRDYLWRLDPRPTGRSFVVTRFERLDPIVLDGQRLSGIDIPALWTVSRVLERSPLEATPINRICEQIIEAEVARQTERTRGEKRDKLIEIWEGVCQLHRSQLGILDHPITYQRVTERDGLLEVSLRAGQVVPETWVVGQRLAMTRKGAGIISAGDMLRTDGSTLTIKPAEDTKTDMINGAGEVREDRGLEYAVLDRQQGTLTAIREGKTANPQLPDVVCGIKEPLPLVSATIRKWNHSSLDEAKREAVLKAFGCRDILLVQGPPGTGKTVAIAELVLQILRLKPKDRVLLVSQSNVAVDQAIERITGNAPEVSLVRLARTEEKVALTVKEWQLPGRVEVWREDVLKRSRQYLAGIGLDPAVGAEVSAIQDLLREIQSRDGQIKELSVVRMEPLRKLSVLSRKSASGSQDGEDEETIRGELEYIDEEIRRLREDREAAVELTRESFASHNITVEGEPAGWGEYLTLVGAVRSLGQEQGDLIGLWDSWRRQFGKGLAYQAALAKRSRVVCGTCMGAAANPAVNKAEYDWVIVDEAGRATAPELLVPLIRGKRAILVGDHKQLPPIVSRDLPEDELDKLGVTRAELEKSLFQLLFEQLPDSHKVILDQQYRMHPSISAIISEVFYEGTLKDGKREGDSLPAVPWPSKPVAWLSTSSVHGRGESKEGHSYRNDTEIRLITTVLGRWVKAAREQKVSMSVGIIAGYDAQKRAIARELDLEDEKRWAPLELEVNTVHAFQGRERDMVIYSAVRSNPRGDIGFLEDLRLLNVALSRARQNLVIIGDATMLRYGVGPTGLNPFREVLDWIQAHPEHATVEEACL